VHFEWLKAAIEAYEKRPAAAAGKAGPLLAALSVIGMLGAIASAFLGSPYAALGAGLGAILFTILAALQYRIRLRSSGDHAEVARIFQEYEVRFGSRAGSIAALKSTFDRLTPVFYGLEKTRQQVTELEKEIPQLEKALRSRLAQLSGRKAAQGDLEAQLQAVQGKHNTLKKACEDLRLALAATQVVPEDYLSEPVKTVFDPDSLKQYERKEKEIESAISEKVNKLGTLKQRVCDLTGDPIDADWAGVIEHLRDRRDEASQGYKELKSRVGSGIVISQVIGEMRAREDERIARALNSPGMRGPIGALTHAYDGIELDGDELVVYNGVQRYLLGMLSTGAQEQVLLALRIGIASHVLKEQKMFLILDDAFQHSDWERRTWLVDEMAVLAGLGWQVLYFSMDDHIRGLFEERVRPKLGKRYQAFELS
jgi:uncharacterized protein YhaN